MKTIAVVGTFDTKGVEHAFLAECIREAGYQVVSIDVGTYPPHGIQPDFHRTDVLNSLPNDEAATIDTIGNDRGATIELVAKAIPVFLRKLYEQRRIDGVISLGGSGGTAIATSGMQALPIGFPKVMVSTMAGGNVEAYVRSTDLLMFPSIVDISGLNRISRGVFRRAAAAVVALAEANQKGTESADTKPLIVASMFGNTTGCVERARHLLEQAGYEVLVFHATGVGGRTMESIIQSGLVAGVLDVTTTEWADEFVGGVMPGGPRRLEAAALTGTPAVIAPGCLDMVNFAAPDSIPSRFQGRRFYPHNPQVTLMRTTSNECLQIGKIMAEKINLSQGEVCVLFPLKGISLLSSEGNPFHDPEADRALLEGLQQTLRKDIPLELFDGAINDASFADRCVDRLLRAIAKKQNEPEKPSQPQ